MHDRIVLDKNSSLDPYILLDFIKEKKFDSFLFGSLCSPIPFNICDQNEYNEKNSPKNRKYPSIPALSEDHHKFDLLLIGIFRKKK